MNCVLCEPESLKKERTGIENDHVCFIQRPGRKNLPGSGLIIPYAHRETVFDLTADEWQATYELLPRVRRYIESRWRPDGYNLGWNCGAVGGQHLFHAHLHVIPRFADEPLAGKGIRYWLKQDANRRPQRSEAPVRPAELHVRRAREQDVEKVAALSRDWAASGTVYGLEAASSLELLQRLDDIFWVAIKENEVVGYAFGSIIVDENTAVFPDRTPYLEIEEIYLAPQFRGAGYGTKLLQSLLNEVEADGISQAVIYSAVKEWRRVVDFYERHGFKVWFVQMFIQGR